MMKRILIAETIAMLSACGGNVYAANPQLIVATDWRWAIRSVRR